MPHYVMPKSVMTGSPSPLDAAHSVVAVTWVERSPTPHRVKRTHIFHLQYSRGAFFILKSTHFIKEHRPNFDSATLVLPRFTLIGKSSALGSGLAYRTSQAVIHNKNCDAQKMKSISEASFLDAWSWNLPSRLLKIQIICLEYTNCDSNATGLA